MGHDTQESESTGARTTSDGQEQTGGPRPESDALGRALDVLAHPHRRAVLMVLQDAGWLSLDSLARAVMVRTDATECVDEASRFETARLRLHHVHLPKLDAADVVTYDPTDRRAACTVEDDLVARLLNDIAVAER